MFLLLLYTLAGGPLGVVLLSVTVGHDYYLIHTVENDRVIA